MAINSPLSPKNNKSSRLKSLIGMGDLADKLLKQKKKRVKLESKFQQLQDRILQRKKLSDKEQRQESKKDLTVKGRVNKYIRKTQLGIGGFFFSLLKLLITYKAVEWASKPENLKALQGLSKALLGVFKFINFFVGGSIDNALSGIHDLLFGGTILERFVGLFKGILGLIGLRYLLKPWKLIKDIHFVIKNSGKILDIFKAFKTSGIKEGADALLKGLSKSAGLFKHGLTRGLTRGFLKIFGKGGVKLLTKLFNPIKNIALNIFKAGAKKTVAGIPIVGPILDLGLNLVLGDPLDKALFKAGGSALGMGIGGFIGSAIPGPGTIVGGALGGLLGDWAASTLYDSFNSKKSDIPKLAVGGIVTSPTIAMVGEAGPEAVIPLGSVFSGKILTGPLGIISSSLIGGVNAVLTSLGPVGNLIRPFATQLFAPYTRDYGRTNYTFSSNLGKKSIASTTIPNESKTDAELSKIVGTSSVHLLRTKDSKPKSRYNSGDSVRALLADIFNNVINLNVDSFNGGNGTGNGSVNPADPSLTAAELDAIKASSADKRAAAHLATLEATSPQHVADVYQVILNRAVNQSGGIAAVITAKEQFTPYSAAIFGRSADANAQRKYGGLGLTKKEIFELASKPDGIQQLTRRFQAGNPKVAAQVLADFEQNGPLSQSAKKFVGGAQYFLGYKHSGARRRPDGGNWFRDKYQAGGLVSRGNITSYFANKESFRKNSHEGIDIAFPVGTPLSFASKGEILKVSRTSSTEKEANGGYGSYMDVKVDGKIARLAHLSSIPSWVKVGSKFNDNSIIAYSGGAKGAPGSGRSGGPHLHLEQHTALKGLEETLNGKVDPLKNGIFSLLRQGGSSSSNPNTPPPTTTQQPVSPNTVPSQPRQDETLTVELANKAAKLLGQLYTGLTGVPKNDTSVLERKSMDLVQSRKQTTTMSDIYMITPSSTVVNNVNMMMPLPSDQFDASSRSFAYLDTPFYTPRKL